MCRVRRPEEKDFFVCNYVHINVGEVDSWNKLTNVKIDSDFLPGLMRNLLGMWDNVKNLSNLKAVSSVSIPKYR